MASEETSEAAKTAGEVAATEVARVETTAKAAVDEARARADAAEQTSRQVADAAMSTALGERISRLESENEQWRTGQASMTTEISQLRQVQTEQGTALGAILGRLTQPSTTPPPDQPSVHTDDGSTKTELRDAQEEPEKQPPVEVKPKKKRFFL